MHDAQNRRPRIGEWETALAIQCAGLFLQQCLMSGCGPGNERGNCGHIIPPSTPRSDPLGWLGEPGGN